MSKRSREEIRAELETTKNKLFCEYMADFVDWKLYESLEARVKELEEELKEYENELRR